jgi:hypothetical protein
MDYTASQRLPYPTDYDPGAGALDLQILAESINDKLVEQFAAQRAIANTDVCLVNLSANQTGISSSVETQIFFNQTLFSSGSWLLNPFMIFPQTTGYFRIGAYMTCNPSGTVNTGNPVFFHVDYNYVSAYPFTTVTPEKWYSLNYLSNTGGEHLVVEGLVRVDVPNATPSSSGALNYSGIGAWILHGNGASTMSVLAGTKMWMYKVSELEN